MRDGPIHIYQLTLHDFVLAYTEDEGDRDVFFGPFEWTNTKKRAERLAKLFVKTGFAPYWTHISEPYPRNIENLGHNHITCADTEEKVRAIERLRNKWHAKRKVRQRRLRKSMRIAHEGVSA